MFLDILFNMKKIAIIGSTGSIGTQTLELIENNLENYNVYALTAGSNIALHKEQINKFKPKFYDNLKKIDYHIQDSSLLDSLEIVYDKNLDFILFATSGSDSFLPISEAITSGNNIGLTNKEVIVIFGPLLFKKAKMNDSKIFPIDSEPSAIWQCIDKEPRNVSKIFLTASGGAFRDLDFNDLINITPAQASRHPNWKMGKKITVDSSTMMNKIFEIVEISYMFDIPLDKIEVLIHRESLVHSMVEFDDGSIKAQISQPDMILPIKHAIDYNEFNLKYENKLDFKKINKLSFSEVKKGKYPCYDFAYEYIKKGPLYVSALALTNEILVELFLTEKISYISISKYLEMTLLHQVFNQEFNYDNIIELREYLKTRISKLTLNKN